MAFSSLATRLIPCSMGAVRCGLTGRLFGICDGGKSGAPGGRLPKFDDDAGDWFEWPDDDGPVLEERSVDVVETEGGATNLDADRLGPGILGPPLPSLSAAARARPIPRPWLLLPA